MPISILTDTEKKNIPDWKEIFIGEPKEKLDKSQNSQETLPEKSAILLKIKNQILKNVVSEKLIRFSPLQFLESDLYGNFHYRKNSVRDLLDSGSSSISEREVELVKFLFDELFLLAKDSPKELDSELQSMLFAILASEGKIEELEIFFKAHPQNDVDSAHLSAFFYLLGKTKEINLNLLKDDEVLYLVCKKKQAGLDESEKNTLYDHLLSGKNSEITGVVYSLFIKKLTGVKNIHPIFQLTLKKFESLEYLEQKKFIEDYKSTNFYFKIYFLMKKIYSKDEISLWLQNELVANGKKKYSENSDNQEKSISIGKKALLLKDQGKIYTLSPFEILLLLNSQLSESVRSDIESAVVNLPNSYLIQRAQSVLYFFDENYESFFQSQKMSGRLKFSPECLYLKAIALKEIGQLDEGNDLLIALEKKFSDSNVLKNSIESHQI